MEPPPTVEALLNKLMVEQDVEIPVERVKNRESVYKICNRVMTMSVVNGFVVIRVGGGYMKFDEWYGIYGKKDRLKVNTDVIDRDPAGAEGEDQITLEDEDEDDKEGDDNDQEEDQAEEEANSH
ncbi:uncharacterized protein ACA1_116960 [Acanthamoeba castellanii str. Neff]|uniref:GAR domain-containing protein n=1 Tax=Acanthamoeba castellanii (strain ATCC 30010 / Neff) TaxID=1257118 RepID=L8H651_ACACF|nr:uncharacterized protein ACA1_116960 [Acanthamoeba castellanii str. Neff]ELR20223.1 hypothetical protein ACA1_116960 [Acanthamoeba castellanii str. Neff]